jgi:hypothetical protein
LNYLEFFIEDEGSDTIIQLPVDQSLLYQLSNAINSYLAKQESPAEKFIDSYLKS